MSTTPSNNAPVQIESQFGILSWSQNQVEFSVQDGEGWAALLTTNSGSDLFQALLQNGPKITSDFLVEILETFPNIDQVVPKN